MANNGYFTPDSLRFLQDLRQYNQRDWFQKNKQCYERVVREPLLRLIGELGSRLRKIDPYFVADPRPIGAQ